ncbi:hypothetical protein [Conexibacter woesei]|uniref:hypothetical protein n=1 Tax=Conexibacter woesei TaxID=191495 RepID=UPI000424F6AE|nr:hypothetical protein [Conexibacter woesei]
MPTSALRDRFEQALLDFAWNEWAQLGVLSKVTRRSTWAQDLEALLVLSFDIARADPRLFDEILDWLAHNQELLSVRRLRTIARTSPDPTLAEAVLTWLAQHRPKARFSGPDDHDREPTGESRRLFFDDGFPLRHPDPAFLEHGWLRPAATPSGKAATPDLKAPIAFGLRLRRMFGPGARAEAVRVLLCLDAPSATASVITRSATYTKGNVLEALRGLTDAQLVSAARANREARYAIDRERWATLLSAEPTFPAHVEWVQLVRALGAMLEWLRSDGASGHLLGSSARQLLRTVGSDLGWADVDVDEDVRAPGAMAELERVIDRCVDLLRG